MCFGGSQPQPAATPAAAPAPPAPTATPDAVGSARKAEDLALFGSVQPNMRVDRSVTSGGVGQGGSGIKA